MVSDKLFDLQIQEKDRKAMRDYFHCFEEENEVNNPNIEEKVKQV